MVAAKESENGEMLGKQALVKFVEIVVMVQKKEEWGGSKHH